VNAFKDEKDYDVLKITAESAELEKLHYLLEKKMKNDNKHPTYCAHLTVAYVKKGKADKLIGDDRFKGIEFQVDHIVYSGKDKNRTSIQFG
jgi:2'-5' RNA ligase